MEVGIEGHAFPSSNVIGAIKKRGTFAFNGGIRVDGHSLKNAIVVAEAVRSGKVVNNAPVSAESTYTAILGRMAAEREQILSWDEMLRVNERLDPKLSR